VEGLAVERSAIRPIAHLIHGFVGAGKTTFARRLAREQDAVRFTHDAWMHRLYGANPPVDEFRMLWERVDALIWHYAERLLALGVDVVLDQGFWTRAGRDAARVRVAALNARFVLYHVTCPEETMRRRVLSRSQEVPTDSLWINAEAFDLFKARFEPLADDEPHILIKSTELDEDGHAE
jgi:predicted kinase